MVIVDFGSLTAVQYTEAAGVLREALAHLPSGYQGPGEAEDEVKLRCTEEDWLGYAALDGERLVGWIGALKSYPRGWEIHPLVVAPDRQRCGIGAALLGALEAVARRADVLTLFLGSDDDYGGTNLFGRDLWLDVARHIKTTEATARSHALTFYRRHGYEIVGLLPDVNGAGCPDILLAKRLAASWEA